MKIRNLRQTLSCLLITCSLVPLLAFYGSARGGEGYEVYVNNKLVLQQFGKDLTKQVNLKLDPSIANQELKVIYHHCGLNGKNRQISLRNESNVLIRTWKFENSSKAASPMVFRLSDVPAFANTQTAVNWSLHYSSSELPAGRQLAVLQRGGSLASRK